MDIKTFTQMFGDTNAFNFTKLKYKYGDNNLSEFIDTLKDGFFVPLSLYDFQYKSIVYISSKVQLTTQNTKLLLQSYINEKYGIAAMEEEIIATLSIEQIDSSRESVRHILNGGAPKNENDNKAYGIKRGLDFISDISNKISAHNLYKLYMMSVGDFLEDENKLIPGNKYRHDSVYVVGNEIEHQGLAHQLLPQYVDNLIHFINNENELDHIIKSIIAHYCFAYLHPYFDGNGRMARLLQLWILIQKGYTSSLFVPFSAYINETKSLYYNAFSRISENQKLSNVLDVTPFIDYFIYHVIEKLSSKKSSSNVLDQFKTLLDGGKVTEKERALFYFVVSSYGNKEFSTKQLEKDYRDVAYATVRAFVMKLEKEGLFISQKFSNRVKYKLKDD